MISRSQIVQRASQLLKDHVAEGTRIGVISRAVGVSERTLRNAFRREHGLSPKQYDVRERLQAARQALCSVNDSDTVTKVASQYGFFELGRFARLYKDAFGESPSETIRLRRHGADASTRQPRPQHLVAHNRSAA